MDKHKSLVDSQGRAAGKTTPLGVCYAIVRTRNPKYMLLLFLGANVGT